MLRVGMFALHALPLVIISCFKSKLKLKTMVTCSKLCVWCVIYVCECMAGCMCSIWEMDNKTITLNLACVNRSSETGGEDGVGNPIGELQEFTQKKLMKPPIYEFSNEQGPPHNREFVCTIKLGKFVEKGASLWCGFSDRNVTANAGLAHIVLMFSPLPTLCLAAALDT